MWLWSPVRKLNAIGGGVGSASKSVKQENQIVPRSSTDRTILDKYIVTQMKGLL